MFFGRLTGLKSCCCCISLRLGCLVIGYLEITGNLFGAYKSFTGEDEWEDVILYILGNASLAFINLLMIWGIHKETKKLLLPWLIIKFFAYLGITLYYGVRIGETFTLLPYIDQQDLKIFILGFLSLFASLLVLAWYTFFCVYSLYKTGYPEVQEAKKEETKEDKQEKDKGKKEKDYVEPQIKTDKKQESKKNKVKAKKEQ